MKKYSDIISGAVLFVLILLLNLCLNLISNKSGVKS